MPNLGSNEGNCTLVAMHYVQQCDQMHMHFSLHVTCSWQNFHERNTCLYLQCDLKILSKGNINLRVLSTDWDVVFCS